MDMVTVRYKENMIVNVLRSATHWSTGIKNTETSIAKAYIELIDNAKYYILIQNQYFISKSFTDDESVCTDMKKTSRNKIINM